MPVRDDRSRSRRQTEGAETVSELARRAPSIRRAPLGGIRPGERVVPPATPRALGKGTAARQGMRINHEVLTTEIGRAARAPARDHPRAADSPRAAANR